MGFRMIFDLGSPPKVKGQDQTLMVSKVSKASKVSKFSKFLKVSKGLDQGHLLKITVSV